MLDEYRVTCTAAVPTIWLMLLQHLEATGAKLPYLNRVVIGGSACPRAMTETFEKNYGVDRHPCLGHDGDVAARLALHHQAGICALEGDALSTSRSSRAIRRSASRCRSPTIAARDQPWDGKTFGRLKVRGPAVARAYFKRR